MSIETAALHLGHLLLGAGVALVAVDDERVVGYLEAYLTSEPPPLGVHLCIAHLIARDDDADLRTELLAAAKARAKKLTCERITVVAAGHETEFYSTQGLTVIETIRRYTLSARTGQIAYTAREDFTSDYEAIAGWAMPSGKLASPRQQWETLWTRRWNVIPQVRAQKAQRLRFNAAGQEALAFLSPQLHNPRALEVYLWSPKLLTSQLVAGLRDWAHKNGVRALILTVNAENARVLGAEAEADGYSVTFYAQLV
jgi:hypothetical protein